MIKSVIFYDCDDNVLCDYAYSKVAGYIITAGDGYSYNQGLLNKICDDDFSIITNDLHIFGDSRANWNDEENHTQAYIVVNDEPKRIDTLTKKEIRKPHNIERMYIAGAFEVE